MKKLLTLSVMFILCLLTFATDFMRIKLKDGNIARYEVDNIEEVDFEIGKDTSIIGDTTAVDTSASPLRFRITSGSTAEVSGYRYYYNNTDSIAIPEKVRINGKIYNVTSIGDGVFGGYSGLTSIRIPESVTSIGAEAFIGCSDLTRINIPEGVTRIDSSTFAGCSSLREITLPKNVTSIGNSAFSGCNGLKSIQIPSSVTDIDKFAFYRCINLDVTIDNSEGNVKVGEFAFEACKSVTYLKNNDITVIDTSDTPLKFRITSDSTVEVMEDYSYRDLDSIFIPAKVRIEGKVYDVTSIDEYAFVYYSNLTSINVSSNNSNYSSIDGVLFNKNKTEIVYVPRGRKGTFSIPSSVTSINSWAFYGCNGLTSINIPNSIKSIADSTFAHCYSLTSINIPNSVTSIGASAFKGCYGLTSISIPNSVTSIGSYTFYNCHGLTSISIPDSVTSIGDGAFRYCSKLTSIDIPNSVTSIGYLAFSECTNLDVTIDNSKGNVSVGYNAFYNCKSVTYLKNNDITVIDTSDTPLKFSITSDSTAELIKGNYSNLDSIFIPAKVRIGDKIYSVTDIDSTTFRYSKRLKYIEISEGITDIRGGTFANCDSLKYITIPKSVTNIVAKAFYGCTSLEPKLLIYDNGTKCYGWIGDKSKCTEVVIPEGVTSIGEWAFYECSSLTSIKIPESVISIGYGAFYGCSNLDVTIDNSKGNVSVGYNAFYNCKSVTYLK